jgi:hypothetical protein
MLYDSGVTKTHKDVDNFCHGMNEVQ